MNSIFGGVLEMKMEAESKRSVHVNNMQIKRSVHVFNKSYVSIGYWGCDTYTLCFQEFIYKISVDELMEFDSMTAEEVGQLLGGN